MENQVLLNKKSLNGFLQSIDRVEQIYQKELDSITKRNLTINQLKEQLYEYKIHAEWLRPEIKSILVNHDRTFSKVIKAYSKNMKVDRDTLLECYFESKKDEGSGTPLEFISNYYLIEEEDIFLND